MACVIRLLVLLPCGFGVAGCGPPPMIDLQAPQYTRIGVLLFASDPSMDVTPLNAELESVLSRRFRNKQWIFGDSGQPGSVQNVLRGQTPPEQLFDDPAAMAHITRRMNADLVIIGRVRPLSLRTSDDPRIYWVEFPSPSSRVRTILVKQTAKTTVDLGLVDTTNGELLWKGKVKGHTEHFAEWHRQILVPFPEGKVRADMWKHLSRRLLAQLFPMHFPHPKLPEVMAKPERKLIRSGGRPLPF